MFEQQTLERQSRALKTRIRA